MILQSALFSGTTLVSGLDPVDFQKLVSIFEGSGSILGFDLFGKKAFLFADFIKFCQPSSEFNNERIKIYCIRMWQHCIRNPTDSNSKYGRNILELMCIKECSRNALEFQLRKLRQQKRFEYKNCHN